MYLIVDNYDSFVYNAAHILGAHGVHCRVYRNDQIDVDGIAALRPRAIVISSGTGDPREAGVSIPCIQHLAGRVPIFGIGLGHACVAVAFGGRIDPLPRPMHGKTSSVIHRQTHVFAGLPSPLQAIRYDSWRIAEPLPPGLEATAYTSEGHIMGLCHAQLPVQSVQFDPASVMTDRGEDVLVGVIRWVNQWWERRAQDPARNEDGRVRS